MDGARHCVSFKEVDHPGLDIPLLIGPVSNGGYLQGLAVPQQAHMTADFVLYHEQRY